MNHRRRSGPAAALAALVILTASAARARAQNSYVDEFLIQYGKIKDPASGYFSPEGIPYHSIETLIVEAPDHGHETTSEAFSFWLWLEAEFGRVTGDWGPFNRAWTAMETFIIPGAAGQPGRSAAYNPADPADYAREHPLPSGYPTRLDTSVVAGADPLAAELQATYGDRLVYGMHWLLDVDDVYGFGTGRRATPECGDDTDRVTFINTYQRGPQESVWETVAHPSCETGRFGQPGAGFPPLFIAGSGANQWRYTDAPDADARAVQAAYWALVWATQQGNQSRIAATIAKAAKLGDFLRYSHHDKYFKDPGCTSTSCAPGSGKSSSSFLLTWYYAWGGDIGGAWAWRIGSSAWHQGYQNPLAAWALSTAGPPALRPRSPTASADWRTSLDRQLDAYLWLQSAEGAIAGGATNSWNGNYEAPPAGTPTFYGWAYDVQPVFHDPPSNRWFGFQAWSLERVAEYYFVTGDAKAKKILDRWVAWALSQTTFGADSAYSIPSDLEWSGAPSASYSGSSEGPAANPGLHVRVINTTQDVGVAAAYARTLAYYAAKSGAEDARAAAKNLIDGLLARKDRAGVSIAEVRDDYARFDDPLDDGTGTGLFIPPGFSGRMPSGDLIQAGKTFLDIRSFYRADPAWGAVQAFLSGTGPAPSFRYHRFWAQADIAMAAADYGVLFGPPPAPDTEAPTAPAGLAVSAHTDSSLSLAWTASTDNVRVTGYRILEGTAEVGTSAGTSFTATGLAPSSTHTYRVVALDAAGNASPPSDAVTAMTDATPPPPAPGLVVRYRAGNQSVGDNQLGPHFEIVNTGPDAVALSGVRLRYWYTVDGVRPQNFWCDYTPRGCGNLTAAFAALSPARARADSYLEIGFTAGMGSLSPGQSTGEIQTRVSKDNWSSYDESNDHSSDLTRTSFADWDRVTLYRNGALVWGVEPAASASPAGASVARPSSPDNDVGSRAGCQAAPGRTSPLLALLVGLLACLVARPRRLPRRPGLLALLIAGSLGTACLGGAGDAPDEPAARSAVAVSAGGVTVDVVATDVWSGGFNGAVRITNASFPAPITSFAVVFRLGGTASITGTPWNGTISPPDGAGDRTATSPSWLATNPITAGRTWDVGFNASGVFAGGTLTGIRMNGQTIPIDGGGGDVPPPPPPQPGKFVGNITTAGAVRPDFIQFWDQITPENEGKWGTVEATRDVMNWAGLDAAHRYAVEHGIPFKEHTLVWGSQQPSWIGGLPAAEQAAEVEEWIQAFCARYPDVALIDVVNEPPPHTTPPYMNAIGGAGATGYDWIVWSFRKARQYCPGAVLILNDYNVLRWETDRFVAIVNAVKGSGLIDAIGAQGHGLETQSSAELQANLDKLAATGLPIYVTEYDIDLADDAAQRDVMARQFPLFWNRPEVAGITLWGYVYGSTWKPNTGLLRSGSPRPAMTWLMDLLGR